MTCAQCGAAVKPGDGRFCSHCGAALPDRPRISPDEWVTHRERFEQAARDPQHAIAMRMAAPSPRLVATVVPVVGFLAVWLTFGGFMISRAIDGPGGGMMIAMPILIVSVGAIGMVLHIVRTLRKARSPVEHALAVVVDERTDIHSSGAGNDHATTTRYYATLQLEDGARRELPTNGPLAGAIARGDIGLAVMRGGDLIDFHRFARI